MADSFVSRLITELTAKTTAADTDLVPVADANGNFFKMTWQKMKQILLGTKDISGVGDGTVTGAISELNTNIWCKWNAIDSITSNSQSAETLSLTAQRNGWCQVSGPSYWDQTFIAINGYDKFEHQTEGDSDGKNRFVDIFPVAKGTTVSIKKPNNPKGKEYAIYFYE